MAGAGVAVTGAAHRWYVCGLREVRKAVRAKRARAVIIAPNIESVGAEGGLDDALSEILQLCEEQGTPALFAMSRKKMGELYGFRKRVSAVGLLQANGVEDLFPLLVKLGREGRAQWEALAPAAKQQVLLDGDVHREMTM
ncbi:C2H2-type domain-containing protein [Haematococcus lacustris]|uniref:C2H2-type domain-containing protein n=1 Tax=Haematococcus lacustris TaxID=44745 RepID=A0A6A0A594_HAELA|nr:C2H2-type domain-containing protein [Haematococcus lacustris]